MALVGLIASLIVVLITWLLATFTEVAGVSLFTLLGFPFYVVYDFFRRKIKYPGKTKEEVEAIEFEEFKKKHYNEHLDKWFF